MSEEHMASRDLSPAAGGVMEWRTMDSAPHDGTAVWTFGTLHRDGIGEVARIKRSWFGEYGWVSDEWGGHEPTFWAPISQGGAVE